MSRYSREGTCEHCAETFRYFLIDTAESGAGHAYCDACGTTALVEGAGPGPVAPDAEADLDPCACGGRFRAGAAPACPHCAAVLSADAARSWLEANARRRRPDWSWQGSWQGPRCIVIENRLVTDAWSGPPRRRE